MLVVNVMIEKLDSLFPMKKYNFTKAIHSVWWHPISITEAHQKAFSQQAFSNILSKIVHILLTNIYLQAIL